MSRVTLVCQHCNTYNVVDFPKFLDSYFSCCECKKMNVIKILMDIRKFELFEDIDEERQDFNMSRRAE